MTLPVSKIHLGVLVSGNGTNLQALLDASADAAFPAEVALVVSNVPTAFALERARRAKVPMQILEHRQFQSRDAFDERLVHVFKEYRVDTVCLAGFMRLLGPVFLQAFPGRILNIHPSLLPAFPGLHAVRQALAYGVKISGCSVHFVDQGLDSGPVIIQAAVGTRPEDTEETLAARILEEEHKIYPMAVRWLAEGRLSIHGRRVQVRGPPPSSLPVLRNPERFQG